MLFPRNGGSLPLCRQNYLFRLCTTTVGNEDHNIIREECKLLVIFVQQTSIFVVHPEAEGF